MNIQSHNDGEIAEIISDKIIIQNAEDALDLMGNIYYQGFDKLIIHKKDITTDFFDLKNKMAGEILQKFSTYRVRLVIIGDFSKLTSKSVNDFMYESNQGKQVNFLASFKEALSALTR
jgi:hypothetical protein